MNSETTACARETLLQKANEILREHQDYFAGAEVIDVEQKGDVLIFNGDFWLDDQGLPTAKSRQVFNLYKFLATELSKKYHLA